ncbi:PXA domain-containing protein [Aspergillus crustosus]
MDLLDALLQFLSTCSNEMLFLVLACLSVITYIILGRIGLLLIGAALGVALHASWESAQDVDLARAQRSNRKQISLNVVRRLLDWESDNRAKHHHENKDPGIIAIQKRPDMELEVASLGPSTAAAVQSLVDAAVRDYVNYWYEPILSESTFPDSCRKLLNGFINSVTCHLSRKRTADIFLEFLTNSSSMTIVFLNELSTAFEAAGPGVTPEDAILQYLKSDPECSLSSLLAHQQQRKKLATIGDDILSKFLDPAAYNCFALRNFFREVLVRIVFESAISIMSKPGFINGWISYLFSECESEIMSAIDAGVEGARNHGVTAVKVSGELSESASMPTADAVMESVSSTKYSDQPADKADQTTEKAALEAQRLSEMIAAQSLPEHADEKPHMLQKDKRKHSGTNHGSDAIPGADMESSEQAFATTVGSNDLGVSLPKQSLSSSVGSSARLEPLPAVNLHRASITVDDSFDSGSHVTLRSKPTSNYLIQVELHSGRSGGWMVFKRYADFESIHETLGTISRLNQLRFGDSHSLVPPWKGRTRQALARDLARYLHDALQLEQLAESVTMQRFLEREGGLDSEATDSLTKPGFVFLGQAAFGNVGKGVLGVLSNAPKGVSEGGKAVLESVSGVFSGGIIRKSPAAADSHKGTREDNSNAPLNEAALGGNDLIKKTGRSSDVVDGALPSQSAKPVELAGFSSPDATLTEVSNTSVPPPESDDDAIENLVSQASDTESPLNGIISRDLVNQQGEAENKKVCSVDNRTSTDTSSVRRGRSSTISVDETRMAVELIFAVINELYSLSSAWNIRRTLLNAAKTFILRPGNPNLETIRDLLQDSMIDSHTTDQAIGLYLTKLRENALPTAEELSSWPPAMSAVEMERQRDAARRVLIQRGLPQAITSVMGAVASREALGRVFDSLQVEVVARGFVFSILLQALRAIVL